MGWGARALVPPCSYAPVFSEKNIHCVHSFFSEDISRMDVIGNHVEHIFDNVNKGFDIVSRNSFVGLRNRFDHFFENVVRGFDIVFQRATDRQDGGTAALAVLVIFSSVMAIGKDVFEKVTYDYLICTIC